MHLGNNLVHVVCRRAIASLYGFTAYKIDLTALTLKKDFKSIVICHRSYSQDIIFDLTFNKVESIFETNVESADPSMSVSALTPFAEIQHEAVAWMSNYFKMYGDNIPNRSDEIHISLPDKKSLWLLYKDHQEEQNSIRYISLQKFYELWNTLFPRYTIRDFVDIPGKCITCYEIDSLRKNNTSNKTVLSAAKELHVLHRGGYFQRERDEYVI